MFAWLKKRWQRFTNWLARKYSSFAAFFKRVGASSIPRRASTHNFITIELTQPKLPPKPVSSPAKTIESVKPIVSAKPSSPDKAIEPVKPNSPDKDIEPVKLSSPAKTIEPVKPMEMVKITKTNSVALSKDEINQLYASALQHKKRDPKDEAMRSVNTLLRCTNLTACLSHKQIIAMIVLHKWRFHAKVLNDLLKINNLSIFKLAMENPECALILLKTNLSKSFSAMELVTLYKKHSENSLFLGEIAAHKIPSIVYIFSKAKQEDKYENENIQKAEKRVKKIILSCNADLLKIFNNQLKEKKIKLDIKNIKKEITKELMHQKKLDLYSLLGVERDANVLTIYKAYWREMTLLKRANESPSDLYKKFGYDPYEELSFALKVLSDKELRKFWDELHPIQTETRERTFSFR